MSKNKPCIMHNQNPCLCLCSPVDEDTLRGAVRLLERHGINVRWVKAKKGYIDG